MASGSYAIKGLQLGDGKKRDRLGWKVEADKQSVKRGDIVTFTITAKNGKFPDGTKRKFVISENFSEADIVDGKIAGEFELVGNKATVEIGIEETYEKPQNETLRFGVTSTFASASVNVESDGGEKDLKRLRGREQKRLPSRREPVKRVVVRQLELPPGKGSIVPRSSGSITKGGRKSLPPGGPRLPGTGGPSIRMPSRTGGVKPQSSGLGDLLNQAQSGVGGRGQYLSNKERISAFRKARIPRASAGIKPISSLSKKGGAIGKIGSALTKSAGGAATKGAGKAAAKGAGKAVAKKIPGVGLLAGAAFGIERLLKGDIVGAVGELASGAASTVPGIGTAVSLGIDGALMAGDMAGGQKALPPAKFKKGGTIIPGMTNMPFSMPGLNGIFNEPGNPEVMSIQPLNPIKDALGMLPGMGMLGGIGSAVGGGLKNIFGGKEKEYKGIASAIGAEMEKRGIGDPLGLKGGKSFGNSVRDLLDKIPGIKDIFGKRDGNTQGQQQGTSPGGGQMSNVAGSTAERNAAAFLSTLEGTSGQNAADAMQVMLNRTADAQAGGSMSAYGSTLFDQITGKEQFSPFSAAIYGTSADPDAAAKYGPLAQQLGSSPEERKQRLLQIAGQPDGMQQLEKLFKGGSASAAGEVLNDFATGGSLSQTAAQGIGSKVSFRGYSRGLPADRFNRGTGGNYFFNNSSTGKVGSLSDVSQSPAMQQPQGAGQTVVLAGGTNSAGDPVGAGRDMMNSIKNLKEKGYRVVVVPPNQKEYPAAYGAIKSAAKNEGAIVEEGTYEISDPLHLTSQFSSQLNSKYAGAIFMGDSNAARIAGDRGLKNVRREGAGTGEILQQAQKMQRAPAANNQLNPGVQQMSYSPSAAGTQAASNAAVQPQTPMQPTAMLEGAGTFVQGNSGNSRGPHFHIGPEQELWGKPEGKAEVRRASFKIAKALINKGEHFSFTNANINIDPNNPPDDATLMKYVEQEQIAHAGRDGGGSFGGIDIAGKPGLRLPLGVSNYKESSTGFGNTATIAGTRAFVAHGMTGSGNTPGANALAPGASPSNGVQLMSNTSPAAPAGNPEDFFKFAFGAQGRESSYTAPPNAAPTALLEASSNTAMASAGPKVAIVNNPVSNSANVSNGGGSQSQQSSRGSDMSDAGLLAYMAKQRLLTLGA
jgi:hypothetical protein